MRDERLLREQLTLRGLSRRTVYTYLRAIQRAAEWLEAERGTLLEAATASDFAAYAISEIPETWSSRKLARSALGQFYAIIERSDDPHLAIRLPPKPNFTCRALPQHHVSELVQVSMEWEEGGEGLAVLIGLFLALRRHEIAKLRWEDFDEGWVRVVGKGSRVAELPVYPVIEKKLRWWREFWVDDLTDPRTRPGDEWVFEGKGGRRPVCAATIWDWTRKMAEVAGVPNLTPHELRHTAIATANDLTQDLRATQDFARHRDPATTVLYTRVTKDRLRGLVDQVGEGYGVG